MNSFPLHKTPQSDHIKSISHRNQPQNLQKRGPAINFPYFYHQKKHTNTYFEALQRSSDATTQDLVQNLIKQSKNLCYNA